MVCWPFCPKTPKDDDRAIDVPLGTATPFCVAVATTSVQFPALTDAMGANERTSPLPGPGFGLVVGPGLSAEHPAISPAATSAASAITRFKFRRMSPSLEFGM